MTKAQVQSSLVTIIIALAVSIILLSAWGIYSKVLKSKSDLESCRLSVLGRSYTKPGGKSPLEIKCPRTYIDFFKNKITFTVKDRTANKKVIVKGVKKDKFNEFTDDIVFQVVADELKNCWYKMGQGKFQPFDFKLVEGATTVCMLCSVLSFNKDISETPTTFANLHDYLENEIIPSTGKTFDEYLSVEVQKVQVKSLMAPGGTEVVDTNRVSAVQGVDEFDTDKTYYLMFASYPKGKTSTSSDTTSPGTYVDILYGELYIVDADKQEPLNCDILYN